ncbi:MAG: hypothetical protein ACREN5_02735, partial [Gemmatimonadales bacterium]
TNYATALTDANLTAGKSYRPTTPLFPAVQRILARTGPHPFTGHEWAVKENENEILNDLRFSLPFSGDSFLVGLFGAFALLSVTSVQEGITGHYTHTIRPSDPIAASGTRQTKVTSMYFEATGPDAGRRKRKFQSLALERFTLNIRRRELIQLESAWVGSGQEDAAAAVTLPALSAEQLLSGTQVKVEVMNQGAGSTDLTARFREATLEFQQVLQADQGYIPNATTPASGKFRSDLRFLRRLVNMTLAFEVDRSSTDLEDRVKNRTRTEVKISVDNGVVAGTGTKNHGFVFRVPDCRLMEAPLDFPEEEAVYGVSIPGEHMYPDAGIGNKPFELVVENTQVSYLV